MPVGKTRRIVIVIIALAGEIAVVAVLSNAVPFAALCLFLVYGFMVPAWFFWDRIIQYAPAVSDVGKPIILIPAFLPVWAAVIGLFWFPTQNFSQEAVWGILILMILFSTGLLLWRSSAISIAEMRNFFKSLRKKAAWIGFGFLCGLGLVVVQVVGFHDLSFVTQPADRYSTLYFLSDQDALFWERFGSVVEAYQRIRVGIGIENHEGMESEYVVIVTQGERRAIAEVNPVSLEDGETWRGYVLLTLQEEGDRMVYFFLERVGFPWPYRQLVVRW